MSTWALFIAPTLLVLAFDLSRRAGHVGALSASDLVWYAAALAESSLLWGALLVASSRGRLRNGFALLLVAAATVAMGSQRYFFDQYATYLNRDAVFFGLTFGQTVLKQLQQDATGLARAHATPLLVALALVVTTRRLPSPPPRIERLLRLSLPLVLLAPMVLPCSFRKAQAATPDVIYLHAMGGVLLSKAGLIKADEMVLPGQREADYVPALQAAATPPRNVVFVLTESVRADAVCSQHSDDCRSTPFTNKALPGRLPLLQMRANDSATAVSVAVLLTGLPSSSARDDLHHAPMVFDYARAAGFDAAYWTSQDLRFGNSDMFVRDLGLARRVAGADLDPDADLDIGADDNRLVDYVKQHLAELREPFVAVLHLSNTHFPYLVDRELSPFQPSEFTKDPDHNADFYRHYLNAVYRQDRAVAELATALRAAPSGPRTVIVYTSDHGEAFREHGQLGHTVSVYDEEVRVPFFVDAPEATLTQAERAALAALRDTPTFHVDVLPTFLDLMGLHDAPELARFRQKMPGQSLLRPGYSHKVQALTNCAAVWGCPFKNWGLMQGHRKLEARQWDGAWHCFDVEKDPHERSDLGEAACGELATEAKARLGGHPRE